MSSFDLKKTIQALLFSTTEPLSLKAIQAVFIRSQQEEEADASSDTAAPALLTTTQIGEALSAIEQEWQERNEVFLLKKKPEGWQLAVHPDYADWVRLLRGEPRPQKLSPAALETLAIIAYRQPVTRAEIEAIRGVSADGALNRLIERELIAVTGRAALPGKPLQYGTSDAFMDFCGISSLEELPASDVLSPQQIQDYLQPSSDADDASESA